MTLRVRPSIVISRGLKLTRHTKRYRCVGLVHAVMWLSTGLNQSAYYLFYSPKVEPLSIPWNRLVVFVYAEKIITASTGYNLHDFSWNQLVIFFMEKLNETYRRWPKGQHEG